MTVTMTIKADHGLTHVPRVQQTGWTPEIARWQRDGESSHNHEPSGDAANHLPGICPLAMHHSIYHSVQLDEEQHVPVATAACIFHFGRWR